MGRGNVCVRGAYEGLYYIDNGDIEIYTQEVDGYENGVTRNKLDAMDFTLEDNWSFDEFATADNWKDIQNYLIERLSLKFPSWSACDCWLGNETHCIAENKLFYVAVVDNEWSMAVELLQKESDDYTVDYSPLQKRHYQTYLTAIKNILFDIVDTLGVYSGPWTSGVICKPLDHSSL